MMGLDAVELVMQVEEQFCIDIPDVDAQGLGVLGDFAKYVSKKTAGTATECTEFYAMHKIIEILERDYGVPVGVTNAHSHIVRDLGLD